MVACPKCGTNIDADFGIQRCSNCLTNVIIELDGSARTEDDSSASAGASEAPPFEPQVFSQSDSFQAPPFEMAESVAESPMASSGFSPPEVQESASQMPEMAAAPTPDPPPIILKPSTPPRAQGDLSDVAAYGNSEVSLARDGLLVYDILIWNIDSRDSKEKLREALTDARFAWDVDKIMNSIAQGALRISQVNSVKSSVLINRIKSLPLGISWEQKLITDSGATT